MDAPSAGFFQEIIIEKKCERYCQFLLRNLTCICSPVQLEKSSSSANLQMGPGDVSLICYFGGKLTDDDKNAKYVGGSKKGDIVPYNMGYAIFREKIREMVKIPLNGMEFKIKCGVRFDEFTLIGMDVDDDQSLRFVMDRSKFIMAYVLEDLPNTTAYTAFQRDGDALPSRAATTNTAMQREDLVLPTAAVQFQEENLIDGTSNHKSVEIDTVGLNPPGNDGMNTNKGDSPSESKFIEWFPKELLPFITGYENPEGDGNCGFRALCMALGRDENDWAWMRGKLVKEMESNNKFYNLLFGVEETIKLLERTKHLEGPAPPPNWMDMPSTGFVFAQAFKVVLVHYSEKICFTFVPSLSPPNTDSANVKVIGIGLAENNHYIKLDSRYGCPLPPFPHVPTNWRALCSVTVNSWEVLLTPRLRAFLEMNVAEQQFDKRIREIMIIDGEDIEVQAAATQFQSKNFMDGTHDASGADMNSLEHRYHRFSQPNADHHDGGIDFSIRTHEHHEDDEVNVPDVAVYEENQVISQMEHNVPPSDAVIGSSDNCLALGREFPYIDALRNALSDMAVMTGREYKHVRTSPSKLIMKCKAEDCNWCIHATRSSNSPAFKVVKYQEVHTCMVRTNSGDKDHPQATVRWILSKVQSSMEKDPNMEPSKIVKEMKDRYGILISYNKAVKAKTKALEVMRGGLEKMSSLPVLDICRALKVELERDSTTICKLGVNSDGGSFQHLFWSFKACIDALRNHLRPVVFVGCMETKIGVLMSARGVDGDSIAGNFIDVGFGIYYNYREEEKCSMWETYLGWLKEFVLPPITEAAVEGIPFSIVSRFEETGGLTGAVENVLPHLHHFFTPLSVASYFSKKFEGDGLFTLYYQACATFSAMECEEYLQQINTINKEAYSWLLSSSVGPKSHWAIAFSPNKHVLAVGEEEWFDYGFYSMLEKKSVVEMVERSREKVANYFSERRREGEEAATTTTTGLAPGVNKEIGCAEYLRADYNEDIDYINSWVKKSLTDYNVESIDGRKYQIRIEYPQDEDEDEDEDEDRRADYNVESIDGLKYQITRKRYGDREVVDLEEKSCTCGKFQAREYPCDHAFLVIADLNLDVTYYINLRWYSLDTYRATYAGILPPPISDHISQWQTAVTKIPHLPPKRTGVGRPPKLQKVSV